MNQFLTKLFHGGQVDEEAYNEYLKKLENETGSPEDALQRAQEEVLDEMENTNEKEHDLIELEKRLLHQKQGSPDANGFPAQTFSKTPPALPESKFNDINRRLQRQNEILQSFPEGDLNIRVNSAELARSMNEKEGLKVIKLLKNYISQQTDEIMKTKENNRASEQMLRARNVQYQDMYQKLIAKEEEIFALNHKNASLQQKIETQNKLYEIKSGDLNEKCTFLESEKKRLERSVRQMEINTKELMAERDAMSKKHSENSQKQLEQIRQLNEEVTNLNEEFGLKDDEVQRLSESFEENMTDLKNLASVHAELLNKYDIIQKDHEMLNITLKNLESHYDETQRYKSTLSGIFDVHPETEMPELISHVENQAATKAELGKQLREVEQIILRNKETIDEQNKKIAQLIDQTQRFVAHGNEVKLFEENTTSQIQNLTTSYSNLVNKAQIFLKNLKH